MAEEQIKTDEELIREAEEKLIQSRQEVTPSVTFTSEDGQTFSINLNKDKMRVGNIMAERILDKLANEYSKKEYPEVYFYCLLALQEKTKSIFAGFSKEQLKFAFE